MKQERWKLFGWKAVLILMCTFVFVMMGSTSVEAKAKAKTYTIQYVKNGGKGKMSNQKCMVGKSYKLANNTFTRKGYIFTGWNTKKNGKGKSYTNQKRVKNLSTKNGAKVKLYAQWQKGITVKFNANSGIADKKSILVVKGKKYGTYASLPQASRAGYQFEGWYTQKTGGSKVTANTKVTIKKTQTLYAHYTPVTYQIVYFANGGIHNNPLTYQVTSDNIVLSAPERTGYTFTGWYTDSVLTNKIDQIVRGSTGNISLYAGWRPDTYTISYELYGGTNNRRNPESYDITSSVSLYSPTREGYTFKGWYTDAAFEHKVTSIAKGTTGKLSLYAKWEAIQYHITYQLYDGTNDSSNPSVYQYDSPDIVLKPAVKEGYEFTGWTKNGFNGTAVATIPKGSKGNITLYANYTLKQYDITYILNAEDGLTVENPNPDSYTVHTRIRLQKPVMQGYQFMGFYRDEAFTDPVATLNGESGDLTLYAKWEYVPVTREEWIAALVDTIGISVSENDLPKDIDGKPVYTFEDIKESENRLKIEAAAQYDIIPYEKDEEGGADYFEPNEAATREFAAVSAVKALEFDVTNTADPVVTDTDKITYKPYVTVALNQEILSALTGNAFAPEQFLSVEEKNAALAMVGQIQSSAKVTEEKDKSEYLASVVQIAKGTDYSVSVNGITVSTNTIPSTTDTDEIVVTTAQNTQTNAIKAGDIVLFPANDIFVSGLALKIAEVKAEADGYRFSCKRPSDLGEIFDTIAVSGWADIDGEQIEGMNGAQVSYKKNAQGNENLDNAGSREGSVSLPGEVTFTFKDKELSDRIHLNGEISVEIPEIAYRVDGKLGLSGLKLNEVYLAVTEQIKVDGKLTVTGSDGSLNGDGAFEIGRAPVPLGATGLSVDIVFWFNYSVTGEGSVTCTILNTNGIQYKNGDLRVIKRMKAEDLEVKAEGSIEVGPKLSLMLTAVGIFDVVDITADGGVAVKANVVQRASQLNLRCSDIGAYLYLKISAGENSLLGELLSLSYSWDIFDESNSPLKRVWHFESDTENPVPHIVDACTYGKGLVKGTIVDAESQGKIADASIKIYDSMNGLVKSLRSDAEGKYEQQLEEGTYRFVISARGYITYRDIYEVKSGRTTYPEASLLIDKIFQDVTSSTASGKIIDSINGNEVSGATIQVRKGWNVQTGDVIQTLSTDTNGDYKLELPLGNYSLQISKDGYVTGCVNIIVKGSDTPEQNGELTPLYYEGEGILRVVLTWGKEPEDLDSHMLGPVRDADSDSRFHVYFSHKDYYDNSDRIVNLDLDDTTSYGPETVTVYQLNESGIYSYYVYDYTNGDEDVSDHMGLESRAKVKVYDEGTLVSTFNVPYGEGGTCWHVFDYDAATREVIPVNTMSYVYTSSSVGSLDHAGMSQESQQASERPDLERLDIETILKDMENKKEE